MKAHFPFREIRLSNRFFEAPVYNTWIELTFYQAQDKVLEYARGILEHGLEPGILMIDDGWSPYYGKWEFRRDNFPDPEAMLRELHDMEVRKQYLPQILEAVDCARKTGEPIVRHMEYVFPGQGMECLMDQFMIGDKLLQYLPQILEAVDCARKTGEPIVRHMEYVFPGQGMECLMDQFMIGDKLLAAPVTGHGVSYGSVYDWG